jgi:hypothetical protein
MKEHDSPGDQLGKPDVEVPPDREEIMTRVDQQKANRSLVIPPLAPCRRSPGPRTGILPLA